jgi:2'-5' RNA ligase
MFHALPGSEIDGVTALLVDITAGQHPIIAEISGLRSLGNGVAFTLRCPELERIRREIAFALGEKLTAQDRQTWRPHITIQNKVSRESARELLERLQQEFQPWKASIKGLELWRYDGGPWEPVDRFRFGIATHPSTEAT